MGAFIANFSPLACISCYHTQNSAPVSNKKKGANIRVMPSKVRCYSGHLSALDLKKAFCDNLYQLIPEGAMKIVIGLFLSFIIAGSVFAQGISVNFDGAKVVYIDHDNILNKMDTNGNVSSVLNTNAGVAYIHFSEQGNLFVVFQSKQRCSDGYDYLLARAVPTNNTISGIDTNLSSIAWDSNGLCPAVQSDSSNNLYYLAYPSGGGLALNKCVNANGWDFERRWTYFG